MTSKWRKREGNYGTQQARIPRRALSPKRREFLRRVVNGGNMTGQYWADPHEWADYYCLIYFDKKLLRWLLTPAGLIEMQK